MSESTSHLTNVRIACAALLQRHLAHLPLQYNELVETLTHKHIQDLHVTRRVYPSPSLLGKYASEQTALVPHVRNKVC